MGDGVEVDLGQLRAHAGAVQEIQARSGQAADAGSQVTPGDWDNAYGVLCQMFPATIRPIAQECIGVLHRISQSFENQARELTGTVDAYDEIDKRLAETMQQLINQLGTAPRPGTPGQQRITGELDATPGHGTGQ